MPVTINGTSGVVSPDGSAGTPAYQGSDANTGMFFPAADTIAFAEGGTEVMRIDSSGNVGIGVTPSAWDGTYKAIQIGARSMFFGIGSEANLANNAYYNSGYKYVANSAAGLYTIDANVHKWYTAASGTAGNAITFTQAMTLDANGCWIVNATSPGNQSNNTINFDTPTGRAYVTHANGVASGTPYFNFAYNGTGIGSITQNGTTAVAFNTTSDHRLKINVKPLAGGLAKVLALEPSAFDWVDGRPDDGFIADKLQQVLPNVVTGEKDAVDENGGPVYQQVDYARIVPTLTAAIQEQQTLITSLTARIAALEGAAQ
jgi:hypothetical protein